MRLKAIGVLFGFGGAAVLGGCATVPREAGFPDVGAEVAERTGGKRVAWNRGGEADAAVAAEVRSLVAQELSLDEAVQVALLNNRNLQAVYENLMIAQADLVEAGLLSNPVLGADIRFFDAGTSVESAVVQDFLQVLYIPLRKRLASAAFEAAKLRVAGAVLDLAGEVRAAYYELEATEQTVEFRRQVVIATGASYDLAGRMRKAGNVTELALANERALYEQSKINLAAAEAQVVQDRERLNELMGLWGEQTSWTTPTRLPELPMASEEVPGENLERRAVEQSLDLGAAALEIEVASRRLGIARPFGAFGFAEAGLAAKLEPDGEWGFGPAFTIPIPLFNQGQPAVARFAAELRRAQQHFGAEAVAVRSRVRAAHQAVIAARARAHYYRQVVLPLRGKIVDESLLQYNAMQIGPIELLIAKQQQIDAANEYIESLREYWLARTDLDQILSGRLSPMERSGPGLAGPSAFPMMGGGGAGNDGEEE